MLVTHVATDGGRAGAGAVIFAPTVPMQVSRASHRRSDPTTQSDEHERYQGGFVGDDGRSQPHSFAATSSRYLPLTGLLPPWPSSPPPKLRSRLYSRSSTVTLSAILAPRPICFSPAPSPPPSPQPRPPFAVRAPLPLTFLTSLTSASNLALLTPTAHHRSHICMTSTRPAPGFESQPPPSRWPARASAFSVTVLLSITFKEEIAHLPPPLPHPNGCGGGGFFCVGVVLVCGLPPALPSVLPGRVR